MEQLNIIPMEEIQPMQVKESGVRVTDDAFYAATVEEGDPVANYQSAMMDIRTTGESSFVKMAKDRWEREQDVQARDTLGRLAGDPNVDLATKKAALQIYALGGFVSTSLKDKYLQKIAAKDTAITETQRQLQDNLAVTAPTRQKAKETNEAIAKELKGQSYILSTTKSLGTVGSSILAAIPAGYAGIFSLIVDQDVTKADQMVKSWSEFFTYVPEDELANKITENIASVAETLDIPFKWIGDKAFELTGSPGVGTTAYVGSSMVGYIGAAQGIKRVIVGKPKVEIDTPAAATATANTPHAANLGAAAVADSTGQLATAMGTSREAIVSQWGLPKIQDEFGFVYPDIQRALEKIDLELNEVYQRTEVDPYLVPKTQMDADLEKLSATFKEAAGPSYSMSNSVVTIDNKGINAKMVFGKTDNYGYETELAAQSAANDLAQRLKGLKEFEQNPPKVEQIEDQYFITLNTTRPYDPFVKLAMGDDVLKTSFLGMDVSGFANSALGRLFFPSYMRMKPEIPTAQARAAHKTFATEEKYLNLFKEYVTASKHKKELDDLFRSGELDGKVWKLSDIDTKYPHLTKQERADLQLAYVTGRRIVDHMYRLSDRQFMRNLNEMDMQVIYDSQGRRLGFASSKITADEKIRTVWDMETKSVMQHKPDTDKFVVRLKDPVTVGSEVVRYAYMPNAGKLVDPHPGTLTRIPGYIPRTNKIHWAVDRVPRDLWDNGLKVAATELRNFKTTVGGDARRTQAEKLAEKMRQENPGYDFVVRKDEQLTEDSIIFDSQVYDAYFKEGHKRGERLHSFYGETELEDVGVSMTRAMRSTARVVGWSGVMESLKKNWVKAYGDFSKGEFPQAITDIAPKNKMSPLEEARFKQAQEVYRQIHDGSVTVDTLSDVAWRSTINKLTDLMEDVIPSIDTIHGLRSLATKGNLPVKLVTALPRQMWLYLRPARQWVVQPSQGVELATIDPKFLPTEGHKIMPIFFGLLAKRGGTMVSFKPVTDFVGGKAVKDYDKLVDAFYNAGILQAVDTNMLVHGLFKDPNSPLIQGSVGKAYDVTKASLQLPGKVGRQLGYDSAELVNQITNFLFSKRQWELKNPGKDWSKAENVEEIAGYAWRLGHGASTRAGMMPWQQGLIGTFLQFAAIPHKGMMQAFSAKEYTGKQKAGLVAARAFWYGVYGVPLGYALTEFFDKYLSEEDALVVEQYKAGIADKLINKAITAMSSDEVETDLAISKSVTVIPETPFFWELGKALYGLATGDTSQGAARFPYQSAYSSVFESVKTVWDATHVPDREMTTEELTNAINKLVSNAGGYNDYLIYEQIKTYRDRLDKGGHPYGLHLTLAEAEAKLWTGIGTKKEQRLFEANKASKERQKYIDDGAREIWKRMDNMRSVYGTPDFIEKSAQIRGLLEGFDKPMRDEILAAFWKHDYEKFMSRKESLLFEYMKLSRAEKDKHFRDMEKKIRALNDPEANKVLEHFYKEGIN